ncbi:deaminase [Candidatus Halobonum tyrrellensis]|uniref:CMP/dCMP-type deaminase domain-containing protein n=1 Tax=Candidatus Halobonum tyrrellensis G22 TaxID=1324957 RepID=V4HLU4_9EURY|nr:nucleoside deaminase [Candidatus Halobonum tyrrellensis]ESP88879.1 hypothetical protein K933_06872 [Candidatus Halobonum tyrrellensis G22]
MDDETLDALDHEAHVGRALELARQAAARGDDPYGSLLVRAADGERLMSARNAVATADDIRRHPELTLAYRAAREFSPAQRAGLVMYTSTEPCPMCAGGIASAELGAVVHSVPAETGAEVYGREGFVRSAAVYDGLDCDVRVVGPVSPAAGEAVHREHRANRREE